jgi:oxygen-dependent protoporphyrinogen oxidase
VVAQRRVAVIGGGISGLATAYHLTRPRPGARPDPDDAAQVAVTVLEAEPEPGGKVVTTQLGGLAVDTGPDAVLMRSPAAAALISELGLDHRLRAPAEGGAYLWSRGRLRRLPAGSMFGVPDRLLPLLRSGLLGPLGVLRAGADLVLPRREPVGDPTIEQVLRPRFGRQVFQRLVEPMLGGVHAGRAGRLSATSAVPEVMALARRHRSLYLALRGRTPGAAGPALMTLEGGLAELVGALRARIEATGAGRVIGGARVVELTGGPGGYRLTGTGFDPLEVDDVVIATPAWEAARLLRSLAPAAAQALEAIPYAGVATVLLSYPSATMPDLPPGTGFLVPPVEGRLLVGCTWLSRKWRHLGVAAADRVVLRAMVGRDGDQSWAQLDDDALVAAVRAELTASLGVTCEPALVHVRRMPRAMPQYTVGHAARLATVDAALAGLPGVQLTGAGYRGVGIAGCLAQARDAAAAVLARETEPVSAR